MQAPSKETLTVIERTQVAGPFISLTAAILAIVVGVHYYEPILPHAQGFGIVLFFAALVTGLFFRWLLRTAFIHLQVTMVYGRGLANVERFVRDVKQAERFNIWSKSRELLVRNVHRPFKKALLISPENFGALGVQSNLPGLQASAVFVGAQSDEVIGYLNGQPIREWVDLRGSQGGLLRFNYVGQLLNNQVPSDCVCLAGSMIYRLDESIPFSG